MPQIVMTPLGPKSMDLIVEALGQHYDPKTTIASMWGIEDVQSLRESLTDGQALEVLGAVKHNHDASIGINWEVIEWHIDNLFGEEAEDE